MRFQARWRLVGTCVLVVAAAVLAPVTVSTPALAAAPFGSTVTSVYGHAVALSASVGGRSLLATPPADLPTAGGGPVTTAVFDQGVPGVVAAQVLRASTSGTGTPYPSANGAVTGRASVAEVSILGGLITASAVTGNCRADVNGGTGSSSLVSVVVAGRPIAVGVPPNTGIALPGVGRVVLNEVVKGDVPGPGRNPEVDVTAIHVVGGDPDHPSLDISVGQAFCRTQIMAPVGQANVTVHDGIAVENRGTTSEGESSPATGESEDRNESLPWIVPDAPLAGPSGPQKPPSNVGDVPAITDPSTPASVSFDAPPGDPTVNFAVNAGNTTATGGGWPPDPTGADSGAGGEGANNRVVLVSDNQGVSRSNDGGATFPHLNIDSLFPTAATPGVDAGRCCDTIVTYAPQIDRFFFLMQYWSTLNGKPVPGCTMPSPANNNCTYGIFGGVAKYRLAYTSSNELAKNGSQSWGFIDLTSNVLGITGANAGMDYPDLSVGDNFLYVSFDSGNGWKVVRLPLRDFNTGSVHVQVGSPNEGSLWGAHLSQNAGDSVYFAGTPNNRTLRAWVWREDAPTPVSWDVTLNQNFCNSTLTATDKTGQDWLNFLNGFPGNAVIGAAFQPRIGPDFSLDRRVWFAWSAGTKYGDGTSCNHPQSHIDLVQVQDSRFPIFGVTFDVFSLVEQNAIWNSTLAFAYPALSADNSEVALSLGVGSSSGFPDHAVGFWGDFLVFRSGNSNATSGTRWGDYVTVRRTDNAHLSHAFSATGFSVTTTAAEDQHYVVFGRPAFIPPS